MISGFNPRSRTGNDPAEMQRVLRNHVSIHVPARGTTIASFPSSPSFTFQSTFPHGERHFEGVVYDLCSGFQSTFPHGERRRWAQNSLGICGVSIHVPARGTTALPESGLCRSSSFNPRSRTGNDHIRTGYSRQCLVSIHVPARGTTKHKS